MEPPLCFETHLHLRDGLKRILSNVADQSSDEESEDDENVRFVPTSVSLISKQPTEAENAELESEGEEVAVEMDVQFECNEDAFEANDDINMPGGSGNLPESINSRRHNIFIQPDNLTCRHCGEKFEYRHLLIRHEWSHSGIKPYQCRLCRGRSSDQAAMLNHIREMHLKRKDGLPRNRINCSITEDNIAQFMDILGMNEATVMEANAFDVEDMKDTQNADELFRFKSAAACNGKDQAQDGRKVLTANGHNTSITEANNLPLVKRFKPNHFMPNPKHCPNNILYKYNVISLRCLEDGCPMVFKEKEEVDLHMNRQHNILPFRCLFQGCGKSFNQNTELSNHLVHHTDKKFRCPKCSSETYSHTALYRHVQNYHHLGLFRCKSPYCVFTASTRIEVVRHYHKKHKLFRCDWEDCNRTFSNVQQLDNHKQSHWSPRPFLCAFDTCGKTFLTKAHLQEHHRTHTGVKPFLCKYPNCNYAAKTRNSVLVHIRSKHFQVSAKVDRDERKVIDAKFNLAQYVEVVPELLEADEDY